MSMRSRIRTWLGQRDPRWILFAAWLVVMAYAFPGYMNFDAAEQIYQARTGHFDDGHPPMMGVYWRGIEMIVRGPIGLLVLQNSIAERLFSMVTPCNGRMRCPTWDRDRNPTWVRT